MNFGRCTTCSPFFSMKICTIPRINLITILLQGKNITQMCHNKSFLRAVRLKCTFFHSSAIVFSMQHNYTRWHKEHVLHVHHVTFHPYFVTNALSHAFFSLLNFFRWTIFLLFYRLVFGMISFFVRFFYGSCNFSFSERWSVFVADSCHCEYEGNSEANGIKRANKKKNDSTSFTLLLFLQTYFRRQKVDWEFKCFFFGDTLVLDKSVTHSNTFR